MEKNMIKMQCMKFSKYKIKSNPERRVFLKHKCIFLKKTLSDKTSLEEVPYHGVQ